MNLILLSISRSKTTHTKLVVVIQWIYSRYINNIKIYCLMTTLIQSNEVLLRYVTIYISFKTIFILLYSVKFTMAISLRQLQCKNKIRTHSIKTIKIATSYFTNNDTIIRQCRTL